MRSVDRGASSGATTSTTCFVPIRRSTMATLARFCRGTSLDWSDQGIVARARASTPRSANVARWSSSAGSRLETSAKQRSTGRNRISDLRHSEPSRSRPRGVHAPRYDAAPAVGLPRRRRQPAHPRALSSWAATSCCSSPAATTFPIQRISLPFVGSPVVTLRDMIGSAGVGTLPPLEQALGVRLAVSHLYVEISSIPQIATRRRASASRWRASSHRRFAPTRRQPKFQNVNFAAVSAIPAERHV